MAALVLECAGSSVFLADSNGKVMPFTENDSKISSPLSTASSSSHDESLIEEQRYAIARRFWSKTVPEISIRKYLDRLHKYCPASTAVYLAAGVYIYRLCIVLQMIPLTELSVHRLVLASIRIAAKALEDAQHPQARFATAAGVSPADLYRLEVALLFILDFNIKVDHDILQAALATWGEVQVQATSLATTDMPETPQSA